MSDRALKASGIEILDKPVAPEQKSRYVQAMFDDIAPRYDLLNTILCAGLHFRWRSFAARFAALQHGDSALDVCTGTGDFAVALRRIVGRTGSIAAVDFSPQMLHQGKSKFRNWNIAESQADALALPFPNDVFDAAVIGFGLRNVSDPARALNEMARVVRAGGRVVCLEFAQPRGEGLLPALFRRSYDLFSHFLLPAVGRMISGQTEAYCYLPASVERWKSRDELSEIMRVAGLTDIHVGDMTFGLVCVHAGTKSMATGRESAPASS